jgi:hypothetical protein
VSAIAATIRDALAIAHWHSTDLWVESTAIGGFFNRRDVDDITEGRREPSAAEYNVLAATLNERLHDLGADHQMRDWDQLAS